MSLQFKKTQKDTSLIIYFSPLGCKHTKTYKMAVRRFGTAQPSQTTVITDVKRTVENRVSNKLVADVPVENKTADPSPPLKVEDFGVLLSA